MDSKEEPGLVVARKVRIRCWYGDVARRLEGKLNSTLATAVYSCTNRQKDKAVELEKPTAMPAVMSLRSRCRDEMDH